MLPSVGLGVVVFVGAGAQRLTGLGFSLVASPFMVLLLGPFNGVLVINACATVAALAVLSQVWRDVDVRRGLLIVGTALPAVLAGAWTARNLPGPPLAVVVGSLMLAALVAVVVSERARVLRGRIGTVVAGLGTGFLNVTAGAGGPALAVYAVSTAWAQARFAATAQLIFAALGAASFAAKGGRPSLAATGWAMLACGLVLGVLAGNRVAHRVPAERARYAVLAIAMAGAALTTVKGFVEL